MPTSLRGRAQQHHFTTALRARLAANARRLVRQRYDWDAIGASPIRNIREIRGKPPTVQPDWRATGRCFAALVEETAQVRRPLPGNRS